MNLQLLNKDLTRTLSLSVITFVLAISQASADTTKASCNVYPKGSDTSTWFGLCTFSQRQGAVGIQLETNRRIDLAPNGNMPNSFIDRNGKPAKRELLPSKQGHIYRLANESIYVYWNPAPYDRDGGRALPEKAFVTLVAKEAGARINVRSEPKLTASSPHYGVSGDKVRAIRCLPDNLSSSEWCYVRFDKSGASGWVRSDFINFGNYK